MASETISRPALETSTEPVLSRSALLDRLLTVGLLSAAVLGVFSRTVGFQFLTWDDDVHITANPLLEHVSLSSLTQFWLHPYENLYIPASYTLFAAEAWLSQAVAGGLTPAVFHAGAVVLHLGCVLLVFKLLSRLVANPLAAWTGALLFALHPLQAESVAWISETRGLLSAVFSLAAVCWLFPSASAADRLDWKHYVLASAAFVLALLSKPSAAALPLTVVAIDWLWIGRPLKRSLLLVAPWIVAALVEIGVTKYLQADTRISSRPDWWLRPLVAGDALTFYLRKLVLPLGLCFDYGRTPDSVLASTSWLRAWAAPLCVLVLAVASPARWKWLAAIAVFSGFLLPVLGLVPFLYQDISTVADRYAYLPMLGAALGLALWLDRHWSQAMFAAACLWLGVLGQVAWQQTSFWQDDVTLFSRGIEANPNSYIAQYMLGTALARQKQMFEAMDHFRASLALNPNYARAHNDLGVALLGHGKAGEARKEIEAALAINDNYAEAHASLGRICAQLKQPGKAEKEYRKALELKPRLGAAEVNWGSLLWEQGRPAEAKAHFRRAIEVEPRLAAGHFRLAEALLAEGKLTAAEQELKLALQCDPELAQAHNNLGGIYFHEHKLAAAAEQYDEALKLNPELVEALFNRGCIWIEQGDTARGLTAFRGALARLPADSPQAAYIRGEIEKYERSGR